MGRRMVGYLIAVIKHDQMEAHINMSYDRQFSPVLSSL